MTTDTAYTVIVVGGGPAGHSAAMRAAQRGVPVALVEKDLLGGTCLNRGCIPTKFLWEALQVEKKFKRARDYGIEAESKGIDYAALQAKKARNLVLLGKGLRRTVESYGIRIYEGEARFRDAHTVEVTAPDGTAKVLTGEKIVIATGSRPRSLPGLAVDHDRVIDSTDALALAAVPASMLVVGGGAIGIELAGIFAGLGSAVQLAEREAQLLPGEDAELAEEVKKSLQRTGVKVYTGAEELSPFMDGTDKVLVATGRAPNVEGLDLEAAGVEHSARGVAVDAFLTTSVPHIYAAGDVTGKSYLAYTAQADGTAAADNATGGKVSPEYGPIPRVVFSAPPAASTGLRECELPAGGLATGRFPFTASGRAFIEGERAGWVKVVAEAPTGRLLAGRVFGPRADELIAPLAVAVRNGLTLRDLSREFFFHPSLSEAVHAACEDALGLCVELPPKTR